MKIDCVSDLHGYFYSDLPGGDLLIIAGDLTARDTAYEHDFYIKWQYHLPYKKIIFIAGNHDGYIEKVPDLYDGCFPDEKVVYLEDSGIEYGGFKIWGSPWTPTFLDWHFMKDRGHAIRQKWDLIPDDTEILITHGPPYGILDRVGKEVFGCEELRDTLDRLKNLKLHVFGHIHSAHGQDLVNGVIHVNASIMDENYHPVNKPIRIEL